MIYALFIITQKGDVLLNQIYRDGVSKGIAEAFRLQVVTSKEQRSPLKQIGDTSFVHVRDKDLYVVAVTKDNSDATGIFEVLYALIKIFKSYFGSFDEESVKDNIVTVVEVLEEILDYGFPQTTDADSIKNLITTQSKAIKKAREDQISQITIQTTGQLPWRPVDLRYKRNEIYIDVIESVNLLMSTAGNVLKADVTGQIMMKTQLSGMPECKLGMNDKILLDKETKMGKKPKTANGIELDDVTMHQCVKLGRFDADRTISFVPPDGEFELMRYRTTENISSPFRVISNVTEVSRNRIEADVTVKSTYNSKLNGANVIIKIPTPKNTATCKIAIKGAGKAKYNADAGGIVWKIRRFPGMTEYTLQARIELISNVSVEKKAWSRPPIQMEFQVPMFAASGLQIRYLRVIERSGYNAVKWVRYLTKAGSYLHRI
jgi:AP-2 complex subunit mu-1